MRQWTCRAALLALAATLVPACGGSGGVQERGLGVLVMNMLGGRGTNGNGGSGGYLEVYAETGGDIDINRRGSVNASVTIPVVAPYLGSNPRTVTGTATITTTAGVNTILGDDNATPATGLWVRAGANVTITPNIDVDDADVDGDPATGTKEEVQLVFAEGVYIQGTLAVATRDGSDNVADLDVDAEVLVIAGGRILSAGADNVAGAAGANGGAVRVSVSDSIVNAGTIDTTGGDDDNGGNGGGVNLYAGDYSIYNAGTIDTRGGRGAAGFGGSAGPIDLSTDDFGVHNTGNLLAAGGPGTDGGGDGNYIVLYSGDVGAITSAGTLDASGGHATNDGDGGNAGYIDLDANSGSARIAGSVRSRGGNGGPAGGNGGDGYYFDVYADGTNSYINSNYRPEGIFIGADIDVSGGTGEDGGHAGYVYIENYAYGYARPVGVSLVGYQSIRMDAGDGSVDGGSVTSTSYIESDDCYDYEIGDYFGGNIFIDVPITARGGSGATGNGGYGGSLYVEADMADMGEEPALGLRMTAAVDLRGGNGAQDGGDGGDFDAYFYPPSGPGAVEGLTVRGGVSCRGGEGAAGNGGDGGYAYFYMDTTDGEVGGARSGTTLAGTIDVSGGNGYVDGGDADGVDVYGDFWIRSTAAILSRGGHGATGDGGNGDDVDHYLDSQDSTRFTDEVEIRVSGSVDVSGGSGAVDGGDSGDNHFETYGSVVLSGTFRADGGTGGVNGGNTSHWYIYLDGDAEVTGTWTVIGGSAGTGTGGDGSGSTMFELYAKGVRLGAAIRTNGGPSASGTGGDGGDVDIEGTESSNLSGTSIDARAGAGSPAGTDGEVRIQGILLGSPTF